MSKFGVLAGIGLLSVVPMQERTVDDWIKDLGSSAYAVRHKAHLVLSSNKTSESVAKLRAAMKSSDVELARRAAAILDAELAADKAKEDTVAREAAFAKVKNEVCFGILPMIWFSECPRHLQEKYVREAPGGTDFIKFRNATEAMFKDLIAQGFSVEDVARSMMRGEDQWVDFCNSGRIHPLPRTWDGFKKEK